MSTVSVPLTKGRCTLIDAADEELVSAYKWWASENGRTWYAKRTLYRGSKKTTQSVHAFLTGWPMVDHINGDGLDNRRANLRLTNQANNNRNQRKCLRATSRFKGVSFVRRDRRWKADIKVDGKTVCLGYFQNELRAALAYDAAARDIFGEFAAINFPQPGERSALLRAARDHEEAGRA